MPVPFQHQLTAAAHLRQGHRCYLADEQGLGKTASALLAAAGSRSLLVLSPTVCARNWVVEMQMWLAIDPREVLVIDRMLRLQELGHYRYVVCPHGMAAKLVEAIGARRFEHLIIDEAHEMRTPTAKRTLATYFLGDPKLANLADASDNVYALSGTPIWNWPTDLWPVMHSLVPTRIVNETGQVMGYDTFAERFTVRRVTRYGLRPCLARNLPELTQRLDGWMLRRKKETLLNLPPIRRGRVTLEPSLPAGSEEEWRAVSAKMRAASAAALAVAETPAEAVEALQRDPSFSRWAQLSGLLKVHAAADLVARDQQTPHKVLVFFLHTEVLEAFLRAYKDAEKPTRYDVWHAPLVITGETPGHKRQEIVQKFQTDPDERVICLQIRAAGVGITLTAAAEVLFVERHFSPAANEQAETRVHRIGQTADSVLVRSVVVPGTVDDLLDKLLEEKSQAMIR